MNAGKIKNLLKTLSPILISRRSASITIALSGGFFLFRLLGRLLNQLQDDPYLDFISALKHYKVFQHTLTGSLERFYKDLDKSYFRRFFPEPDLYKAIRRDLEWVYTINPAIRVTITKRGVVIYHNYQPNDFNLLLLTAHSGTWMPERIDRHQDLSDADRLLQEDIDTHLIYGRSVLEKGGIWIDNKLSRFACDYNRDRTKAIYRDGQESWLSRLWKKKLPETERAWLLEGYDEFYTTLDELIESYRFSIIFDGHSMHDAEDRPDISFGTKFIPPFYQPVVASMREQLQAFGYGTEFNQPYSGGHIVAWLNEHYPDRFTCSLELNKRLYMNPDHTHSDPAKVEQLATDLTEIFDFRTRE